MKPYPAYKPSGVPWLGEVPAHWEVQRLRFRGQLNPSIRDGLGSGDVASFLPMEAIGEDGSLNLEATRPVGEVTSGYTCFEDDDVTIAKITPCFENGKGAVMRGLRGGIGFGTTELIVIRPSDNVHPDWLYYLTQSDVFRKRGESMMNGAGGQKRVPDLYVKDLSVAWPSIEEQEAIANYLDTETTRIYELIREKEGLIGLLRESIETVITVSVTGGLNAAAQRQPEQHKGLDKVPADWCVVGMTKKIESIVDYRGKTPTKTDDGVFLVTARNIGDGRIDYEASKEYVSADEYEDIMRRGLPRKGDVLFTTEAPLGHVAQVDREDVALAQRVIKFRGLEGVLNNAFLKYWLMSRFMQETLKSWSSGSTAEGIKSGRLVRLPLALPPIEEQHEIVEYIETEIALIDDLIAHTTDEIKLLHELRAATITDAVTGKIQVSQSSKITEKRDKA